jgi:hypothetical protein
MANIIKGRYRKKNFQKYFLKHREGREAEKYIEY